MKVTPSDEVSMHRRRRRFLPSSFPPSTALRLTHKTPIPTSNPLLELTFQLLHRAGGAGQVGVDG